MPWKRDRYDKTPANLISYIHLPNSFLYSIYRFLESVVSTYSQEQAELFVKKSMDRILEKYATDGTYCSDAIAACTSGASENVYDYYGGLYIYHCVDNYILDCIDLLYKYFPGHQLATKLTSDEKMLLGAIGGNSVRLLSAHFYVFSLGTIRFQQSHRTLIFLNECYNNQPSIVQRSLFGIQAILMMLPVDSVLLDVAHSVLFQVDIGLEKKEEAAVGIHLMASYLVVLLLTLVYDREYVIHDYRVCFERWIDCVESSSKHDAIGDDECGGQAVRVDFQLYPHDSLQFPV